MKYLLIILIVMGITLNVFGQKANPADLLKQLDTASSDYSKYLIYDQLAIFTKSTEEALTYAEKTLALARKINKAEFIAKAYYKMAASHFRGKQLDLAIDFFDKTFDAAIALKDTTLACKAAYFLGKSNYLLGDNKKALEHYFIALDLDKKRNNFQDVSGTLDAISFSYLELDDFDTALKYAKESYKIAKENGLGVSYPLDMLGNIYERMGNYSEAKKYYSLGLMDAQQGVTHMNYGIGMSNLGNIYMKIGVYDSAMYYITEFLKIAELNEDEYYQTIAYNQIAEIQLDLGEFDAAKENISYAMKYNENNEIKTTYMVSLCLLSEVLIEQEDYEEAKKIIKKGLKEADNTQTKVYYIFFHNLYGKLKRLENDFSTALKYHQKALFYAKELDRKVEIGETYYYLAVAESKLKKYDEAIDFAEQSLQITKAANHRDLLNDIYQLLAELTAINKDYKAAYAYQLSFQNIQDSLLNTEKNKYLIKFHKKFQVDKKEAENEILKDKNNQNEIVIKQRTLLGFGLGLGLLVLFTIATWLFYNNRQKERYNIRLEQEVNKRTIELKKANKNLEQANYELRTFNYIASHDIKEPIRVIGGYAGLIFKRLPNDLKEKLGDYFDTIKRSTSQLYTLIEDFARYTTLSKDEVIEKQEVDLNFLTNSIIEQLQETIKKHKGIVNFSNLPTIKTGNSLLFTTLKNLIENGLKYNKSETPTVNIAYESTDSHHQITISDNGIGIEKQYHEKIFEMFKRLHNRGAYEGSGIGLAIVKLSVEKLGGTVEVESEKEKGSQFIIKLPK